MCGRYAVSHSADELAEEFGVDRIDVRERLEPDWNVAPTKDVYAVLTRRRRDAPDDPPERRLRVLRWGLVPSWAKDPAMGNRLINARVETAHEKPAFRRAFALRRCLLPADGFYEWYTPEQEAEDESGEGQGKKKRPRKQPFFIHHADGSVLAMAGLYEIWRDPTKDDDDPGRFRWTCTILTTTAQDDLGRIHDRAPLLVDRDKYATWLDPTVSDQEVLGGLLVPAAPGRLEAYPVSTLVNNVKNNGSELVEPLAVEPELPA
jgi:putative SOS response-associated peptidase YedK